MKIVDAVTEAKKKTVAVAVDAAQPEEEVWTYFDSSFHFVFF